MKKVVDVVVLLLLVFLFVSCSKEKENLHPKDDSSKDKTENLTAYVNPFIATGGDGFYIGSGLPGATVPFGMIKLSPDTQGKLGTPHFYHCSGYYYPDEYIAGFSHMHLYGTGVPEYGTFLVLPRTELVLDNIREKYYRLGFDKANEIATPGFYSVVLENGVKVELTATEYVGFHRYTFPADAENRCLLLDAAHVLPSAEAVDSHMKISQTDGSISGWLFVKGGYSGRFGGYKTYFYAKTDSEIKDVYTWDDSLAATESSDECSGAVCGGYICFGNDVQVVNLHVAISFVSEEGARKNLELEPIDKFDDAQVAANDTWNTLLNRIKIDGATEEQKTIFYTALYHSMMMPTVLSDADGSYMGFDKQVHKANWGRYYSDFSLWDTFRTQHELLAIVYSEFQKEMVYSLLAMANEGGYFPKWPLATGYTNGMIGTHADIVVADSYLYGIEFPAEEAFSKLLLTADGKPDPNSGASGRSGIDEYLNLGFVAADKTGASVSRTLEFAHDDYALCLFARALGKDSDAERLCSRAANWKNLYNKDLGFFMARNSDGEFLDVEDFDPTHWYDYYTEADAWQYLFYVPQDVDGLAEEMGGKESFVNRLIDFFENSIAEEESLDEVEKQLPRTYYWHGNEPDLHTAFMFSAMGRPDLSCKYSQWIANTNYKNAPNGLAGNDDAGTLSSWYIFASSGIYPFAGTNQFMLSCPFFESVSFELPNGRSLILKRIGELRSDGCIDHITLNGEDLDRFVLSWDDIKMGAEIDVYMCAN